MSKPRKAYAMDFEPIVLKDLVLSCGITQSDLQRSVAEIIGRDVSRPTMNLCVNRGYIPSTMEGFKAAVETVIAGRLEAQDWLTGNGLTTADIWNKHDSQLRKRHPAGHSLRVRNGLQHKACLPGDPEEIILREVEMISQEAMRHFKLFRNPFIDDIQKDSDVYMSDEHRYVEAAMLDASRHGGFLAVLGEVGSGKSVMRRKVVEQLKRDGDTLVILESMKMEIPVLAEVPGTVTTVGVKVGDVIQQGDLIAVIS